MTEKQRPLRVIQSPTGNAGSKALAGIIRHPGLELVGVHLHSEKKVGLDAADLIAYDPARIKRSPDWKSGE